MLLPAASQQIEDELSPYRKITKKMISNSMAFFEASLPKQIYRFKVIKGNVYTNAPYKKMWNEEQYVEGIVHVLKKLAAKYPLPDTEFIYFAGVAYHIHTPLQAQLQRYAPLFSGYRQDSQKGIVLWCDRITEDPLSPLHYSKEKLFREINQIHLDWGNRKPQLFWRGLPTDYQSRPSVRHALVNLSLQYPQLINARLTGGWKQFQPPSKAVAPLASIKEHLAFKYQIVLDGINCSNAGLQWRLYSNSAVLKVNSSNRQWCDVFLIPHVHYYPVKKDLSDLIHAIFHLQADDGLAQSLASNAKEFAQTVFDEEFVFFYSYLALKKYSELLTFRPVVEIGDRKV